LGNSQWKNSASKNNTGVKEKIEMGIKSAGARAAHEAEEFAIVAAFLAVFFCAFNLYRSLVLHEYGLIGFRLGTGLIGAAIVAKVVLIGRMLRLGERFGDQALIVPILWKVVVFGALAVAFVVVEHIVEGLVRGTPVLGYIRSLGSREILARIVVLVAGLLPLTAMLEIDRVMGGGSLVKLVFGEQRSTMLPEQAKIREA
jgi:hypothetical protein